MAKEGRYEDSEEFQHEAWRQLRPWSDCLATTPRSLCGAAITSPLRTIESLATCCGLWSGFPKGVPGTCDHGVPWEGDDDPVLL